MITDRPSSSLHSCYVSKEKSNIEGCIDEGVCSHLHHTDCYILMAPVSWKEHADN